MHLAVRVRHQRNYSVHLSPCRLFDESKNANESYTLYVGKSVSDARSERARARRTERRRNAARSTVLVPFCDKKARAQRRQPQKGREGKGRGGGASKQEREGNALGCTCAAPRETVRSRELASGRYSAAARERRTLGSRLYGRLLIYGLMCKLAHPSDLVLFQFAL